MLVEEENVSLRALNLVKEFEFHIWVLAEVVEHISAGLFKCKREAFAEHYRLLPPGCKTIRIVAVTCKEGHIVQRVALFVRCHNSLKVSLQNLCVVSRKILRDHYAGRVECGLKSYRAIACKVVEEVAAVCAVSSNKLEGEVEVVVEAVRCNCGLGCWEGILIHLECSCHHLRAFYPYNRYVAYKDHTLKTGTLLYK